MPVSPLQWKVLQLFGKVSSLFYTRTMLASVGIVLNHTEPFEPHHKMGYITRIPIIIRIIGPSTVVINNITVSATMGSTVSISIAIAIAITATCVETNNCD